MLASSNSAPPELVELSRGSKILISGPDKRFVVSIRVFSLGSIEEFRAEMFAAVEAWIPNVPNLTV